jgi:hypothetical protein
MQSGLRFPVGPGRPGRRFVIAPGRPIRAVPGSGPEDDLTPGLRVLRMGLLGRATSSLAPAGHVHTNTLARGVRSLLHVFLVVPRQGLRPAIVADRCHSFRHGDLHGTAFRCPAEGLLSRMHFRMNSLVDSPLTSDGHGLHLDNRLWDAPAPLPASSRSGEERPPAFPEIFVRTSRTGAPKNEDGRIRPSAHRASEAVLPGWRTRRHGKEPRAGISVSFGADVPPFGG